VASEPTAEQLRDAENFRRGFDLYLSGNIDELLELYDPAVVVTAPEFMNAGPFHGHTGYIEWVQRWNEAWETLEFRVGDVEPVGGRHIVADVHTTGRGRSSGVEVEVVAWWMVEMRDGRAVYLEVLTSREGAVDLVRQRESDA
jgi:ketosteroid isomerase-like protein